MIPVTLWVLATLDGAFAGYRAAAGRNALIRKRAYYRRAMLTGALVAQLAVAIAALVVLLAFAFTRDRESLLLDYQRAGFQMLLIYLPYAAIILHPRDSFSRYSQHYEHYNLRAVYLNPPARGCDRAGVWSDNRTASRSDCDRRSGSHHDVEFGESTQAHPPHRRAKDHLMTLAFAGAFMVK